MTNDPLTSSSSQRPSFDGRACLVTGGANGIGRCIAEAFLAAGARVAVLDRDGEGGRRLAGRFSGKVLFVQGDVGEEAALCEYVRQALAAFGKVHCLVNNAGVSRGGLLSGCGYEAFNEALRIGVTAPYFLAKLLCGHWGESAAIVNIASTRAFQSQPGTESYTAAKGGLVALTHALSVSLAGVARVNCVSPGWIDTSRHQAPGTPPFEPSAADRAQHPVGRIGRPEDIAAAVLFLCGEGAAFLDGQNLVVDGGMSKQMIYHGDHGWSFAAGAQGK